MVLRYKEFVCMVILPLLNGSLFSTYWWHWWRNQALFLKLSMPHIIWSLGAKKTWPM
jgi:hypothetical protein